MKNRLFRQSIEKKKYLWQVITKHQGETFYTAKQLPFIYQVKGGEFFTERKKKSITKATFEKAYKTQLDQFLQD